MHEITLMNPSKETDNKLRWSADVKGVEFKLYIPQSRVPQPWPRRIRVKISEAADLSPEATPVGQWNLEDPITCTVEKVNKHTETVRYRPIGAQTDWELGEPYIPFALLLDDLSARLQIEVRWDRSTGTWA